MQSEVKKIKQHKIYTFNCTHILCCGDEDKCVRDDCKGNGKWNEIHAAEGKHILVRCEPKEAKFFKYQHTQTDAIYLLPPNSIVKGLVFYHSPIIISETEKLEVGDAWINLKDSTLGIHYSATEYDVNYINERSLSHCKKIIVLPEQYSPEHLQQWVDGKIKENDKVLVECTSEYFPSQGNGTKGFISNRIKLDPQGHVIIHEMIEEQKTYNESEVLDMLAAYSVCPSDYTVDETKKEFPHQFNGKREHAAKWLKTNKK